MISLKPKKIRARLLETRRELKPVLKFILVENLHSAYSRFFGVVQINSGKVRFTVVWISPWLF